MPPPALAGASQPSSASHLPPPWCPPAPPAARPGTFSRPGTTPHCATSRTGRCPARTKAAQPSGHS
eukprot:3341921-Lingulodinium_polyedra.AAC.1